MSNYQIDNLWELIDVCDDKTDGSIPIWNADKCVWETTAIPWGTMDCVWVQACMAATITPINTTLSNHTAALNNLDSRVSTLEPLAHSHTNLSVLNWLRNDLGANQYLWWDWAYHVMPRITTNGHVITSNGVSYPQRDAIEFDWSYFIVVDDDINNRTIIRTIATWGGSTPTPDDYVNAASLNTSTNILTLSRALWGTVTVDLSPLAGPSTDELVKVGSWGTARYLNTNDFEDNGTDIEVKKQMSIESDNAWLKLVNDEDAPGANRIYGTDASGNKGWLLNTGIETSVSVTSVNTYTFSHWLNKRPNIVAEDSSGNWVAFGARTVNANTTELTFSPAFTWTIYAN